MSEPPPQAPSYASSCPRIRDKAGSGFAWIGEHTVSAVFTAPFDEEWTREAQELVRVLAKGRRVRILLPDDIQMEDYAPAYEVTYGLAAAGVLRDETTRTEAGEPTLLVVDFAPQLWPDDDALLPELNAALAREWPPHLSLAVITPNHTGLEVDRFDACLELSTAFTRTST